LRYQGTRRPISHTNLLDPGPQSSHPPQSDHCRRLLY